MRKGAIMTILQTEDLKKYYGQEPNITKALDGVNLSVEQGEFLAVVGTSGSGKSTLLRIIAGVEKEYQGEVVFAPGYTVGYLPQDPQLNPDKTVLDIVKEGVADTVAILDEYNRINEQFGLEEVYSDPDKMDALMRRQGELQDEIDAKLSLIHI